jgi:hypothetical protein
MNEKPEHAYERLTEELRNQVVEMWNDLANRSNSNTKKPAELTHA